MEVSVSFLRKKLKVLGAYSHRDRQRDGVCTASRMFKKLKYRFILTNLAMLSAVRSFSKYSVLQNVMMPLLIRGTDRKSAQEKAEEILEMVGLKQRKSHKPNELFGGQQQRVAIARALITHPAVLLADEPTGALDSKTGQEILSLFRDLNRQGNTIIQITHDSNVAKVGSRTLTLRDGVLFC